MDRITDYAFPARMRRNGEWFYFGAYWMGNKLFSANTGERVRWEDVQYRYGNFGVWTYVSDA
jgi:hypothetical protein